ncbi:MAG: hypothetical protein H8E31_09780 [Planctomycetes bacterium]|nr:hypothetical protein [Planctomycetota bacterium]
MSDPRPLPELGADEVRRLEAFAEELRLAHRPPPLSPGFAERLAERQVPRWTWRRAMRQNRLLRVAAGVLVTVAASVPVMAVIQLLTAPRTDPPAISFQAPRPAPAVEVPEDGVLPTAPANTTDLTEALDGSFIVAGDRQGRLDRASFRWRQNYPVEAPAAFEPAPGELDAGLAQGLALRFGRLEAGDVAALAAPAAASPEQLWLELERQLASGHPAMPADDLVTRVRQLWDAETSSRAWLAGWIWILDGERNSLLDRLPDAGGAGFQVFWKAADRNRQVWPAD